MIDTPDDSPPTAPRPEVEIGCLGERTSVRDHRSLQGDGDYSLANSARHFIEDDNPRWGHARTVLAEIGLMTHRETWFMQDGFGVSRKVARLLVDAGRVTL